MNYHKLCYDVSETETSTWGNRLIKYQSKLNKKYINQAKKKEKVQIGCFAIRVVGITI